MSGRYGVKEVFLTLQGEGKRAGAKSVFVRFSGCNLWDGRPHLREDGAGPCAMWCDTDFFKGEVVTLEVLIGSMNTLWEQSGGGLPKWCVLTGGEPALQIDAALVDGLRRDGWRIAVETNGTVDNEAVRRCDHVCVSPKRGTSWRTLGFAHEVKVVLPGSVNPDLGWTDVELEAISDFFGDLAAPPGLFVQPQDAIDEQTNVSILRIVHSHGGGLGLEEPQEVDPVALTTYHAHVNRCAVFVMHHPGWRLGVQQQKYLNLL